MDIDEGEQRIKALTREKAETWVDIAQLLHDLEAVSRTSSSGRAWPDLLREHLDDIGAPISTGHLYKMRRAFSFLMAHVPAGTNMQNLRRTKISAVDVAERLYRLDPEQGKTALADVLADTPYIELQARYEDALASKPEMRSPRQLAWARRSGTNDPTTTAPPPKPSTTRKPRGRIGGKGPSDALNAAIGDLLKRAWSEGREEGLRQSRAAIEDRDAQISRLQADLSESQEELQEMRHQMKLTYKDYRECMGDAHEVDWDKYMAD